MDEQVWMHGAERRRAVELLIQQVVRSIEAAKQHDTPFYHLRFDHFFPNGIYAAMLETMPAAAAYRQMSGRAKGTDLAAMYPGYRIAPHTDTHWKGISVQIYLACDRSAPHLGTIFHERLPDGSLAKREQMVFAPNSGYAFAVGQDTWHSVDIVGPEVQARDSILLTYFVGTPVCFACFATAPSD